MLKLAMTIDEYVTKNPFNKTPEELMVQKQHHQSTAKSGQHWLIYNDDFSVFIKLVKDEEK